MVVLKHASAHSGFLLLLLHIVYNNCPLLPLLTTAQFRTLSLGEQPQLEPLDAVELRGPVPGGGMHARGLRVQHRGGRSVCKEYNKF